MAKYYPMQPLPYPAMANPSQFDFAGIHGPGTIYDDASGWDPSLDQSTSLPPVPAAALNGALPPPAPSLPQGRDWSPQELAMAQETLAALSKPLPPPEQAVPIPPPPARPPMQRSEAIAALGGPGGSFDPRDTRENGATGMEGLRRARERNTVSLPPPDMSYGTGKSAATPMLTRKAEPVTGDEIAASMEFLKGFAPQTGGGDGGLDSRQEARLWRTNPEVAQRMAEAKARLADSREGRQFSAGESDKDRRFKSGEGQLDREHQTGLTDKRMTFEQQEAQIKRLFDEGQRQKEEGLRRDLSKDQIAASELEGKRTRRQQRELANIEARARAGERSAKEASDYVGAWLDDTREDVKQEIAAIDPKLPQSAQKARREELRKAYASARDAVVASARGAQPDKPFVPPDVKLSDHLPQRTPIDESRRSKMEKVAEESGGDLSAFINQLPDEHISRSTAGEITDFISSQFGAEKLAEMRMNPKLTTGQWLGNPIGNARKLFSLFEAAGDLDNLTYYSIEMPLGQTADFSRPSTKAKWALQRVGY